MTEERCKRQDNVNGRDFLSTSDGDHHLELNEDYASFISEEETPPKRSVQFLFLQKNKPSQLPSHPNRNKVNICMKIDTKHRVNGFMHRLSLQMRRRPNADSKDLQVKRSPTPKKIGQSPCLVLVRGPTLHPYRTVPIDTTHHKAISLHLSLLD